MGRFTTTIFDSQLRRKRRWTWFSFLVGALLASSLGAKGQPDTKSCESICAMEAQCKTLAIPDESQRTPFCLESCGSPLLDPELRSCLAKAADCDAFSGCMTAFSGQPPLPEPSFEPSFLAADASVPTSPCPSISGGCTYPTVCCTEIYGHGDRVHVCSTRHCPEWCLGGVNPLCLRCACPKKHDVYPGWPPPPAGSLGLASFNGSLVLGYKADEPGKRLYVATSSDGTDFSDAAAIHDVKSNLGPSLAAHDGGVVLAYKESRNSQRIWAVFSDDGKTFSGRVRITKHSATPPAITWFKGEYYIAFRAHKSKSLWIASSTDGRGQAWTKRRQIESQYSPVQPALIAYKGQLVIAYPANSSLQRVIVSRTSDLQNWSSVTLPASTAVSPALAVFQDSLVLAFSAQDHGNDLVTYSSSDGSDFSSRSTVEGQSSPGPLALAATSSRLYMGYKANDSSNTLYITSTEDVKVWDEKTHLTADTTP